MFKVASNNDGSNGFRFVVPFIKGLYRKRLTKNARAIQEKFFGIKKGKTMVGVHLGKRSVYLQRLNPAKHRKLYKFAG